MLQFSKACIVCKSLIDLDTKTTVKMTDNEFEVAVCAKCSESSMKTIKDALSQVVGSVETVCKDISIFTGREVKVSDILAVKKEPDVFDQLDQPEVEEGEIAPPPSKRQVPQAQKPLVHNQPGKNRATQIVNRPISRDGRGGGSAAPKQRKAAQPTNTTGKPVEVSEGIEVFENLENIESHIGYVSEESYLKSYKNCAQCQGNGGIVRGGKTILCKNCSGSGIA